MFAYVGAITGDPDAAGGPDVGVSVLSVEPESGRLDVVQSVTGLQSPTYLALHPQLPFLYAAERDWPSTGPEAAGSGALTTLAIDGSDGRLAQRARQPTGGPAHVSVHPSGRFIFAAMPRRHEMAVFGIQPDGTVGQTSAQVEHSGRGPRPPLQEGPYPHSVWSDASGQRVLCCDLGIDRVMVYDLDHASGALQPSRFPHAQVSSGAGPRHLAVHPHESLVYVLNELDSTISVFRYDATSSALSILQTQSMLPKDFTGQSSAAHVLVHPSGQFLYASNRGHDSLAMFSIDSDTGKLRLLGHEPSGGQRPRNFCLDASGALMLVANELSGTVSSMRLDASTGRLAPTGHQVSANRPVCVVARG